MHFWMSLESQSNNIILDLAALQGSECRFHCRIYTLEVASKSSHTSLRCIFWSATWNKKKTLLTHSFSPAVVRQKFCLHHIRGGQPCLAKIQQEADLRKHTVYSVGLTLRLSESLYTLTCYNPADKAKHHTSQNKEEERAERWRMSG